MHVYYRRNGTPYIGPYAFYEFCEDWDKNRFVGNDFLKNGLNISTVWLGFDHSFGLGVPLIFETMVFLAPSYKSMDCQRYATEEEAQEGHKQMCLKWGSIKSVGQILAT